MTEQLQLIQQELQQTYASSCSAGCSLIATYSVFFCWAASYDQYPRESHSLPQASWTPDEGGLKTRLRLFGRVFPIFVRIVGREACRRGTVPSRPAGRPGAKNLPRARAENTAGLPSSEIAAKSPRRRASQRFPGARAGLQYEFTRPAVAGPAAETSPGSDRLGRKARAAETPQPDSLNKTTRTL